jgi:hypothetical protein
MKKGRFDKQLSNDRGEVLFNVECQKDILLKYGLVWFQIKTRLNNAVEWLHRYELLTCWRAGTEE